MTAGGRSELPAKPAQAARIRLCPVALVAGAAAEPLIAAGEALALAGGRLAFAACHATVLEERRRSDAVLPVPALRDWIAALPTPHRDAVTRLVTRLIEPREFPAGIPVMRPAIMGILNVTPDSFSDGGAFGSSAEAVAHGLRLARAGADIIDVGGESVRPGAEPVAPDIEAARVLPVIEGLADALDEADGQPPILSIDSRHAEVMRAALGAGATMINDVTALSGDPRSLGVAAAATGPVVLMHMAGDPRTMNEDPHYLDVALDVFDYLEQRMETCIAAGIERRRLIVDPGIGFAKRRPHNRQILRALPLFHGLGCPVLAGMSRKGLSEGDEARAPRDRVPGSLAAAWHALGQGVQILRAHDVAETRQVVELWDALTGAG